ncbi:MAG TPA: SH3 domain-containing protein [Minicystis sp.]|nr:SH3 domain-containing protein [Minicystis sp.]
MSSHRHAIALAGLALVALPLAFAGCMAGTSNVDSDELHGAPEVGSGTDGLSGAVPVGSTLKATTSVNLRSGPSTSNAILHVVPAGATVTVVSSNPTNGFYQVNHGGTVGWSYGQYYTLVSSGNGSWGSCSVNGVAGTCIDTGSCAAGSHSTPGYCPGPSNIECCTPDSNGGGGSGGSGGGGGGGTVTGAAIARAKSGTGFSYWWGHGRFRPEGPTASTKGTCSGSCPSCSHGGSYGGDCSGYAAKVWEVPSSNTDLTVDEHPYSTSSFNQDTSLWSTVSRSSLKEADALVYNTGGEGHIFIYGSGDGWGSIYAYECKGCSYGCVAGYRTASSAYHGIRRAGY